MSSSLRAEVMAMPEEDRLEAALGLLDGLTNSSGSAAALSARFNLTPSCGRILHALMAAAPDPLSHDAIMGAVWGGSVPENAANILRVQIHNLRRKLPAHMKVLNVYGVGYMIEVKP